MIGVSRAVGAVIVAASLASTADARADAFGVFGFGAAAVGEANARAARADDGTATYYSPGGLAFGHGARVEIGTQAVLSRLEAAGQHPSFDDPIGMQLALDTGVPLRGFLEDRIRVGLGIHALPTSVLRITVRKEGTPELPYYDNRTQRLVVLPAVAIRITDRIGIGVSLNVLAGLSGTVDVRPGTSRAAEPRIDQSAGTVVSPILGLRLDPIDSLHLALVWRQRFGVDIRVATAAEIGGVPLDAVVEKRDALFDPAAVTLAGAVDLTTSTSVEIDATYFRWKSWAGPAFHVDATLPGVRATSIEEAPSLRDTFTVRGAVATTLSLGEHDLTVRGGGGYEPTMLGDGRQGTANLVDASKIILAAGATLGLRGVLGDHVLRVGLGLQTHLLPTRTQTKIACTSVPCAAGTTAGQDASAPAQGITDPGYPKLTGGGFIGAAALSLGVDL